MKSINLIAAIQSKDGGIGLDDKLLYRIKEDMKYFVDTTTGHTVIMGRKTWDSIPEKYRPLPGRVNIVVTHDKNYSAPEGVIVCHSLEEAYERANEFEGDIFVIGGGELYTQALSHADKLYITLVESNKEANIFFPDYSEFGNVLSRKPKTNQESKLSYEFLVFTK